MHQQYRIVSKFNKLTFYCLKQLAPQQAIVFEQLKQTGKQVFIALVFYNYIHTKKSENCNPDTILLTTLIDTSYWHREPIKQQQEPIKSYWQLEISEEKKTFHNENKEEKRVISCHEQKNPSKKSKPW